MITLTEPTKFIHLPGPQWSFSRKFLFMLRNAEKLMPKVAFALWKPEIAT